MGFGFLASSFLFMWAYLELTQGASYFRRFLGLIVLLGIVCIGFGFTKNF